MTSLRIVAILSLGLAIFGVGSVHTECQGCDAALSQGIMTTSVITSSVDAQSSFNKWLCSTEFRTHQEARDAGIGIGAIVYGVPLQLTGTFSQSQRDTWKKDNCQGESGSSQYSARYAEVLRYVNPEAFKAWSECKRSTSFGVLCWIETPDATNAIFKSKWNPIDGDKGGVPVVSSSTIVGASLAGAGTSSTLLKAGSSVVPSPAVALQRTGENNIVAVINTSRGQCTAYSERPCNPKYETKWFSQDEAGHPFYQDFGTMSHNMHGSGQIATGRFSLSNPAGRITKVDYSCVGYRCGWSYNPDGGYGIKYTLDGDGKSFTWFRNWDGDPTPETYRAYYEVQRTVCVSDCACVR